MRWIVLPSGVLKGSLSRTVNCWSACHSATLGCDSITSSDSSDSIASDDSSIALSDPNIVCFCVFFIRLAFFFVVTALLKIQNQKLKNEYT